MEDMVPEAGTVMPVLLTAQMEMAAQRLGAALAAAPASAAPAGLLLPPLVSAWAAHPTRRQS